MAGGASALSQKILEAVLGDQAVRALADDGSRRPAPPGRRRCSRASAAASPTGSTPAGVARRCRRRAARRRPGRRGRPVTACTRPRRPVQPGPRMSPRLRGRHRRADLPAMLLALDEAVSRLDGRVADPAVLQPGPRGGGPRRGAAAALRRAHRGRAGRLDRQRQVLVVQRPVGGRPLAGGGAAADDVQGLRERLGRRRRRARWCSGSACRGGRRPGGTGRACARRSSASSTGSCCSTCPTTTRPSSSTGSRSTGWSSWSTCSSGSSTRRSTPTGCCTSATCGGWPATTP